MPLSCCPARGGVPLALALAALVHDCSACTRDCLALPSVPPAPAHCLGCPSRSPPLPLQPRASNRTQPQTENPKAETGPISPPMLYACPGPQPQNIIHTVFASRRDPGRKHLPGRSRAKKFFMKKSYGGHAYVLTWLARELILNLKDNRPNGRL